MFKILMFHTTLDEAKGTLPIDAIKSNELPSADYYALGHLHIDFQYQNFVYPGPVFPNNFQELEALCYGSFYIVDTEGNSRSSFKKIEIKLKEILPITIYIKNALTSTEQIIAELEKKDLKDKIILLRLKGEIEQGKNSDIKFPQIEDYLRSKGIYFMLKNTHELNTKELELEIEVQNSENIEEETIKIYSLENPSDLNRLIPQLMNALSLEKQEDEKNEIFTNRLLDNAKKLLRF